MGRQGSAILCAVLIVMVIVAMDVVFFRGHLWERLMANVGMVLLFAAFYLKFLRRV